ATFSSTYTGNVASDFAAVISWGDATTSTGSVTGSAGNFTVLGGHSYADEGNFTVTVSISEDGDPGATATATATSTATVSDNDILTATGSDVSATEGITMASVTVATFTSTYTGNIA